MRRRFQQIDTICSEHLCTDEELNEGIAELFPGLQGGPQFWDGVVQSRISKDDFATALEYATEQADDLSLRDRFRIARILRRPAVFNRVYGNIAPRALVAVGELTVDFDSILDWFIENWDEILKILLAILPLFI